MLGIRWLVSVAVLCLGVLPAVSAFAVDWRECAGELVEVPTAHFVLDTERRPLLQTISLGSNPQVHLKTAVLTPGGELLVFPNLEVLVSSPLTVDSVPWSYELDRGSRLWAFLTLNHNHVIGTYKNVASVIALTEDPEGVPEVVGGYRLGPNEVDSQLYVALGADGELFVIDFHNHIHLTEPKFEHGFVDGEQRVGGLDERGRSVVNFMGFPLAVSHRERREIFRVFDAWSGKVKRKAELRASEHNRSPYDDLDQITKALSGMGRRLFLSPDGKRGWMFRQAPGKTVIFEISFETGVMKYVADVGEWIGGDVKAQAIGFDESTLRLHFMTVGDGASLLSVDLNGVDHTVVPLPESVLENRTFFGAYGRKGHGAFGAQMLDSQTALLGSSGGLMLVDLSDGVVLDSSLGKTENQWAAFPQLLDERRIGYWHRKHPTHPHSDTVGFSYVVLRKP